VKEVKPKAVKVVAAKNGAKVEEEKKEEPAI
jgi:hypothetical protein